MRGDDQIGQLDIQQRVALARWLGVQHIQPGAAQSAGLQGGQQRRLVHQPAARGVDQQRVRLHQGQLGRANQATGVVVQRQMQAQHIGLGQRRFKPGIARAHLRRALALHAHQPHAQRRRLGGQRLANRPAAAHRQRARRQVFHRRGVQAKLRRLLPAAFQHGAPVGKQIARQRQHQHQGVLGHRIGAVVAHIAHRHAMRARRVQINLVHPGGRHRHQLELGQLGKMLGAQRHFIADQHLRAAGMAQQLLGRGGRVILPAVRQWQRRHGGRQAVAIQKHNRGHGGGFPGSKGQTRSMPEFHPQENPAPSRAQKAIRGVLRRRFAAYNAHSLAHPARHSHSPRNPHEHIAVD